jgi:hypothetical protein
MDNERRMATCNPISVSLARLASEGTKAHQARDYPKRNHLFELHDELFLEAWHDGYLRAQAWRS